MPDVTGLGNRVRELRVARGMSQGALGGADYTASYVSLIEAGKRHPTLDTLLVLAERLGTTVDDLTGGTADAAAERAARSRAEVDLDLKWARIAIRAGNPASAEKYARIVLDDSLLGESERLEALALLAAATEGQGRVEEAIEILEGLQAALDPDETRELWLSVQSMLLRCYKQCGDLDHAVSLGERALAAFGAEFRDEENMIVISLAQAYSDRGDLTRARMLLTNVISRAASSGSLRSRGGALWNSSMVAAEQGRMADALALSEQALAVLGESEATRNLGMLHANCGFLMLEDGSGGGVADARTHFEAALSAMQDEASQAERCRVELDLARCDLLDGDVDRAETRIIDVRASLHDADDGVAIDLAFADLVQAHVLVARGHAEEGLEMARLAAEATERDDVPREASRTWMTVADLAAQIGDTDLQVEALRRSVRAAGVRPTRVVHATADTQSSRRSPSPRVLSP
ncbi:helix-turn-helix domain-containing protein [Solicola sp. PLA-1-18]|uniref:helix-turn-helix domain-containing protein n=1 Tax=Solicola sp. PLA-1-18 TaxID=3380532 RepID=UPI003B76370B